MGSIVLFSPDLSRNPVYVPWQFKGALERRHRVSLVGPASGPIWAPLRDRLKPDAVLPGRFPFSGDVMKTAMDVTQGADLLYAFKAFPESLGLALRVGRRRRIPVAVHLCDWDAGFFSDRPLWRRFWYGARGATDPYGPLALWAGERLIPRADLVTVSTRALRRRFGGTVVPQGVDTHRITPEAFPRGEARRRSGVHPGEILVLFLGTPRVHKGLGDVARSLRRLRIPGLRFLIVGGGREEGEALRDPLLADAEIRPPVPLEEAPWLIRASDVFVVPQRATPFAHHQLPAKLLLGMALGATILATSVGDAGEILGGDPPGGRVVPPADEAALASALAELVESPSLREALGEEARRRAVARFSWDAMDGLLRPVLESVLRP